VPIFKEGSRAVVVNYRLIFMLNNICKIFKSVLHEHHSFNFKSTLNPNQHGFLKLTSIVTNLLA
jgi:hypothetical protein